MGRRDETYDHGLFRRWKVKVMINNNNNKSVVVGGKWRWVYRRPFYFWWHAVCFLLPSRPFLAVVPPGPVGSDLILAFSSCCRVLCRTDLSCTALFCTALSCTALTCTTLCRTELSCPAVPYPVLSCPVVSCRVLCGPVLSFAVFCCLA